MKMKLRSKIVGIVLLSIATTAVADPVIPDDVVNDCDPDGIGASATAIGVDTVIGVGIAMIPAGGTTTTTRSLIRVGRVAIGEATLGELINVTGTDVAICSSIANSGINESNRIGEEAAGNAALLTLVSDAFASIIDTIDGSFQRAGSADSTIITFKDADGNITQTSTIDEVINDLFHAEKVAFVLQPRTFFTNPEFIVFESECSIGDTCPDMNPVVD